MRTYGCQMNVHDSERLAGLLETAGYVDVNSLPAGSGPRWPTSSSSTPARSARTPTTSSTATSASCARPSSATPTCRSPSAAAWRRRTATPSSKRAPWVDVVFGTHNIGSLPALLDRARHNKRAEVEILESLEVFPSTLPTRRDSRLQRAGCRSRWAATTPARSASSRACAARRQDRRPGDDPRRDPGARGAGRRRGDPARPERQHLRRRVRRPAGVRQAAARVRRDRGPGAGPVHQPAPGRVHRRRHRRDGRDAERHAEPAHAAAVRLGPGAQGDAPVLPQHEVPRHHRPRSASRSRTRRSPPTSSSASPARPRRTSRARSTSCEQSRFSSAFTFQYSIRPGTPAATMDRPGAQGRRPGALRAPHRRAGGGLLGREPRRRGPRGRGARRPGEGRKDAETHRLSGRARDNRLVHFAVPEGAEVPRPGDLVTVGVTYGAPHHLVADAGLERRAYAVRRTPGGDAWAALQDAPQGRASRRSASGCRRSVDRPQPRSAPGCSVV